MLKFRLIFDSVASALLVACRAASIRVIPISQKHTIVPDYFPALSETAPLSPRFTRLTKKEIQLLQSKGLVRPVNPLRNLWSWTHLGSVKTPDSRKRVGGLVSLAIPLSVQDAMASQMAGHA